MNDQDLMISLLLGLVALLAVPVMGWRIHKARKRRLRERKADLLVAARRELNPVRRRALILAWNDLGGLEEMRQQRKRRLARLQGEQARGGGRPLSANPFPSGYWGAGRAWKQGWWTVERNIRWIESHRRG